MSHNDPILVKFRATEHFIIIRTVTRQRKSPHSFDLPRSAFIDLESDGSIVLKDGDTFADIRLSKDHSMVRLHVVWLYVHSDHAVHGFEQTIVLDYQDLVTHAADSLREGRPTQWSMLSVPNPEPYPRLDFSSPGAQRTIRDVLAVPVLRHKLTRAVRDNFKWPHPSRDHVIRFYSDCDRYSFFFQEYLDGNECVCGGLILHKHDGLAKSCYSVHT